jgi:hypothetical protein
MYRAFEEPNSDVIARSMPKANDEKKPLTSSQIRSNVSMDQPQTTKSPRHSNQLPASDTTRPAAYSRRDHFMARRKTTAASGDTRWATRPPRQEKPNGEHPDGEHRGCKLGLCGPLATSTRS